MTTRCLVTERENMVRRTNATRGDLVGLTIGVVLLLAFAALSRSRVLDDAYITYRFARNLAEGHGLVWNVGGERTEGFTSPLHVLLCAGSYRLGCNPVLFTRVLSLAALVATGVLCRLWISKTSIEPTWLASLVWPLVFGNGLLVYASLFGLETVLFTLFLTAAALTWWDWCERPSAATIALHALAVVLAIACRPDACAWFAPLVVIWIAFRLIRRQPERTHDTRQFVVAMIVIFVVSFVMFWAKYVYFGHRLPNPFYVKRVSGLLSALGVKYVVLYLAWAGPLVLGTLWGVLTIRKPGYLGVVIASWVFIASYATFDPLMGTAFRFLLPVWPIITVCGLVGLADALRRVRPWMQRGKARRLALPVVLLGWGVLWIGSAAAHITEDFSNNNTRNYTIIGTALHDARINPVPTLVAHDLGALPYFSRWNAIDLVGLTTNEIARMRRGEDIADFVLQAKPEIIILRRYRTPRTDLPVFVPHSRAPNLARCLWNHPLFKSRYKELGSIGDEDGNRITFWLDTTDHRATTIVTAFKNALTLVPGSLLANP